MIAEERPRVTGGMRIRENFSHPFHEAVFINVITEDQASFNTADNDVVEHSFSIETGMTGHR